HRARGQQGYRHVLSGGGGLVDDRMGTRPAAAAEDGRLLLVVNAARTAVDYAHLTHRLPAGVRLEPARERALLALQGPAAHRVMLELSPTAAGLAFMTAAEVSIGGLKAHISRSGYTRQA